MGALSRIVQVGPRGRHTWPFKSELERDVTPVTTGAELGDIRPQAKDEDGHWSPEV